MTPCFIVIARFLVKYVQATEENTIRIQMWRIVKIPHQQNVKTKEVLHIMNNKLDSECGNEPVLTHAYGR